jgi:hypothetical protein
LFGCHGLFGSEQNGLDDALDFHKVWAWFAVVASNAGHFSGNCKRAAASFEFGVKMRLKRLRLALVFNWLFKC